MGWAHVWTSSVLHDYFVPPIKKSAHAQICCPIGDCWTDDCWLEHFYMSPNHRQNGKLLSGHDQIRVLTMLASCSVSSYSDLFHLIYFSSPHSFSVRPTDLDLTVGKAREEEGRGSCIFTVLPPPFQLCPGAGITWRAFSFTSFTYCPSLFPTHAHTNSNTRRITGPGRDQPQSAPGNESIDSSSFNILFRSFFFAFWAIPVCVCVSAWKTICVCASFLITILPGSQRRD